MKQKYMYVKKFKKIVYGYITVEAENVDEAEQEYNEGNYDEFDNKSDYYFEDWECVIQDPAFDGRD